MGVSFDRCSEPRQLTYYRDVIGVPDAFCDIVRDLRFVIDSSLCGPTAKWFQPKPPSLFQKLISFIWSK